MLNDNFLCVYIHLVWSTRRRQPVLHGAIERRIHRCVAFEASKLGCKVLAVNGMADHIHCLISLPSTRTIAVVTKQLKGVSACLMNTISSYEPSFNWQRGYGCFSVSRENIEAVKNYIANQKQHHRYGSLVEECEEWERFRPLVAVATSRPQA